MNNSRKLFPGLIPVFTMLVPAMAYAHTGAGHIHGWLSGWSHPFGGPDHLCAMIAVGLWAAQMGGKAVWRVPLTFVGAMLLGGILGMLAFPLPFMEGGIVMSVLVLGVLIAAAVRLSLVPSTFIVGTFAIFHGYAHGTEMPQSENIIGYALGFLMATAALHVAGIALGWYAEQGKRAEILRYAGGIVAAFGGYLWLTT